VDRRKSIVKKGVVIPNNSLSIISVHISVLKPRIPSVL
jgi:hypothetical protein